jgi:uncharacterized membrane protein YkvA (DUF1232 family)
MVKEVMVMIKQEFEDGHQHFESTAKDYYEQPEKTEKLISKASKKAKGKKKALVEVWDRLHLLFDMVTAWRKGEYREIPKGSIIMILATIIYFVSPIDTVPDFLIGIGILDDAAVIGFTLRQIASDLDKYKIWQEVNKDAKKI